MSRKSSNPGNANGSAGGKPIAVDLRFEGDRMLLDLADGRRISIPLGMYPTLNRATVDQRANWRMVGRGHGFHWPEMDLDLSTVGLVAGYRESFPEPPRRFAPVRREPSGAFSKAKIEIYRDELGYFHWRMRSPTGEWIAESEAGFEGRAECESAIEEVRRSIADAELLNAGES